MYNMNKTVHCLTWNTCEDFTHTHQGVLWNLPPNRIVSHHRVFFPTGSMIDRTSIKKTVCHFFFNIASCRVKKERSKECRICKILAATSTTLLKQTICTLYMTVSLLIFNLWQVQICILAFESIWYNYFSLKSALTDCDTWGRSSKSFAGTNYMKFVHFYHG